MGRWGISAVERPAQRRRQVGLLGRDIHTLGEIARQMGHASTEMLFKVYSRYVPNLTRQDGSAFERLLTQSIAGEPSGDEDHEARVSGDPLASETQGIDFDVDYVAGLHGRGIAGDPDLYQSGR